ncbi:hypothetical protein CTAYLR_008829 [Chrysophaeum taylorii]|uniref:DUF4455 domain-containing protein n=1 Tax=Chrysophaeum taylorii TaxID=2483200 RepID=A0AAD7UB49_9STRA|nr:hypothetical protein CTAYLR_008829 [Chrysophaeum taylorii]
MVLSTEVEEVALLSFPREENSRRTEFPKIANREALKREAHDASVKGTTLELRKVCEEIEGKVLDASLGLKAALEKRDDEIEAVLAEMKRDEVLVTKEASYLPESWEMITKKLEGRHAAIERFRRELEDLEVERAASAGAELRNLASKLAKIAHFSKGEIERLVESEAREINGVMIANRRSHAELVAMLEKRDVAFGERAIGAWRDREAAWRRLRHEAAIRATVKVLASEQFTNPGERTRLFEDMRARQEETDAVHRAKLLGELGALSRESSDDESARVAAIKEKFREIADAEDRLASECEHELGVLAEARAREGAELREALRAELHDYGALAEEPDLAANARVVESVALDPELEPYFRSAGGLKAELRECARELRGPELIYGQQVAAAKHRLGVLVCGADLASVLERQGKFQLLATLRETLERLRKAAGKSEISALLQPLEQQLKALAGVAGLDALLARELSSAAAVVERVARETAQRGGISTRGSCHDRAPSVAPSRASYRSAGSRRTARTTTTTSDDGGLSAIAALEVRTVQKRVAAHARVCDLDAACISHMRLALRGLDQKVICNEKIDAAIRKECDPVLEARLAEYDELRRRAVAFLDHQTSEAYEHACRLCDFYGTTVRIVETARESERAIDEKMLDDLYELGENARRDTADLEARIAETSQALRHAADAAQLDAHFRTVLGLLEDLESRYRDYHAAATAKARTHAPLSTAHLDAFRDQLCDTFFLLLLEKNGSQKKEEDLDDLLLRIGERRYAVRVDLRTFVAETLFCPVKEEEEEEEEEVVDEGGDHPFFEAGFRLLSEEEEKALEPARRDAYLDTRAAKFKRRRRRRSSSSSSSSSLNLNDDDEAYAALAQEIDAHLMRRDAEQAAKVARACREMLDATRVPLDPKGIALVRRVALDKTAAVEMLTELRLARMTAMEARAARRTKKIERLTKTRLAKLTEELEERLRTHWPRKGRTEVSFRQPREGELIAHHQRTQRHVRLVEDRDREHTEECKRLLYAATKNIAALERAVEELEAALPSRASLAGLQGIESKCKTLFARFQNQAEQQATRIVEQFAVVEPTRLYQLNDAMLKATRLFEDGGDYSEPELDELKERLEALKAGVQQSVARRAAACEGLRTKQAAALELRSRFQRASEARERELSLGEGLGRKFGAPRRNAQEKLRTLQTRDEARADDLDALLSRLEGLLRGGNEDDDDDDDVVSRLEAVGTLARERAIYLDCLVPKETAVSETTLETAVAGVDAQCRRETLELYRGKEDSGKEDSGKEDSVPSSLEAWLAEAARRVLETYREKAVRRLRTQIQRLERVVAKSPGDPSTEGIPALVVSAIRATEPTAFATELYDTTARLVAVLDGLLYTDDIAKLPEDEYLQPKRKSLKRLRKAKRKGQPPEEPKEGRNFPHRDWPGLPNAAHLDAPVTDPIPGSVTTAHRLLIKARDAAWADYNNRGL